METCLGQSFNKGRIIDTEIEFLIDSFNFFKARQTAGNCTDLQNRMKFKPLIDLSNIILVPTNQSPEIIPIQWLNCLFSKRRLQSSLFGGTDKTSEVSESVTMGLDPEDQRILHSNGLSFASNVKFSDLEILFTQTRELNEGEYDFLRIDWDINRTSGRIVRVANFTKNGEVITNQRMSGECQLMDVATRKF